MKKEKLVLTDLRFINGDQSSEAFKVKKIVNTTEYKINQYLSTATVDLQIMHNRDMTIEIIAES